MSGLCSQYYQPGILWYVNQSLLCYLVYQGYQSIPVGSHLLSPT